MARLNINTFNALIIFYFILNQPRRVIFTERTSELIKIDYDRDKSAKTRFQFKKRFSSERRAFQNVPHLMFRPTYCMHSFVQKYPQHAAKCRLE